jgi:hypothetical protein
VLSHPVILVSTSFHYLNSEKQIDSFSLPWLISIPLSRKLIMLKRQTVVMTINLGALFLVLHTAQPKRLYPAAKMLSSNAV